MGSVYQRGGVWWLKFSANGRIYRESAKTTDKEAAKQSLKIKEGKAALGEPVIPRVDRIRYDELAADLRRHYETTGSRAKPEYEKRLAHLDRFFADRRGANINPAVVTEYVAARQVEKAANGSINRELAVLVKMLRLAYEGNKLTRLPRIRKLKEAAPRAGFVEPDMFRAIVGHLPEVHALALRTCYALAWRRAEVFTLAWRNLDLKRGCIRIDTSKNGEARTAYLPPDLLEAFRAHRATVERPQVKLGRIVPDVFVRLKGKRAGRTIGSFRKRWTQACVKAGHPGLLIHDLRRSGIRTMVRAGISEHVAMAISGHKTRSVFARYDITAEADLQAAAARLGTISGTVAPTALESRRRSR
jgi:integrase